MIPHAIPPLFDRIPPALLGPLSHPGHQSLYWSILSRFYQYEFEREPFFLVKPMAIEAAEEILRVSPVWIERREELLALEAGGAEEPAEPPGLLLEEAALAHATARRLVARLEAAGWYHFEYRKGIGQVLNFHPYSARLLDLLVRIARDEQPIFQGYVHSIASLLKPEAFASRPGVSLREAKRHTLDLVRELKILNQNIFFFTQKLLDGVSGAADILKMGLEDYRQAVQKNYHRLKTVENLYRWRGEILHRLEVIERDAMSLETAARWYAEQMSVDLEAAGRHVAEDLRILRLQFETLPEITDDIDRRNSRFSGAALRKLMYLLRHDKRIEGQLQFVLDRLARDEAPELEFDLYRCELLQDSFLYSPPKKRERFITRELVEGPRADLNALRQSMEARLRRPFSRARIEEFVEKLLAGRLRAPLSEADMSGDEDYLRILFASAYGLDGASFFKIELDADPGQPSMDRKGIYGFPRAQLARKRKRKA